MVFRTVPYFCFGAPPSSTSAYSWFCTQGTFLMGLGIPYVVLGTKPWSRVCKANVLPTV